MPLAPPSPPCTPPPPFHTVPRPCAAGIVFGGLDGVITTFSIVAAVAGAQLPIQTALLMGFSNLIADAISMGLGDFLSSKAEKEYMITESKRELWEFEHAKELEVAEQEKLFTGKGMSAEDAKIVTATLAKYPALFHEVHLPAELGFAVPDDEDSPAMDGFVTFLSFIVFGSVPMWSYVITCASAKQPPRACARAIPRAHGGILILCAHFYHYSYPFSRHHRHQIPFADYAGYRFKEGVFGIACAFTALTLFLLGVTQAQITKQGRVKTGLLMTLNGGLAAAAAYLIGWGLEHAIGNGVGA